MVKLIEFMEKVIIQMKISKHQESYCEMCEEDASKYNHCAWCGETFQNQDELLDHLDGPCLENMLDD